jgi:hypothetical protein
MALALIWEGNVKSNSDIHSHTKLEVHGAHRTYKAFLQTYISSWLRTQSNSMKQRTSWEAESYWPSQKIFGTRMLIAVFTRDCHWTLSWICWIKSSHLYSISLNSILILSSLPCRGLPSYLFISSFQTKNFYADFVFPILLHAPRVSLSLIL